MYHGGRTLLILGLMFLIAGFFSEQSALELVGGMLAITGLLSFLITWLLSQLFSRH